jgi:hypothetical protein
MARTRHTVGTKTLATKALRIADPANPDQE